MSWDINKKVGRPKKSVKPFGSDAQTGERTVFGSNSISDELEENLSVDFERGWGIVPQESPPTRQDFNAGMFTNSLLASYLFQQGVPEWDGNQAYFINSIVQKDGQLFVSTDGTDGAANIGNDPAEGAKWVVVSGGGGGGSGTNLITNPQASQGVSGWKMTGGVFESQNSDDGVGGKVFKVTMSADGNVLANDAAYVTNDTASLVNTCSLYYKQTGGASDITAVDVVIESSETGDVWTELKRETLSDVGLDKWGYYQTQVVFPEIGSQIRFSFVATGATQFDFDNVHLGSIVGATGAFIGEWEEFTPDYLAPPDNGITVTSTLAYKRRVGENLEISFELGFSGTTPTSGDFFVTLPDGLNIGNSINLKGIAYCENNLVDSYYANVYKKSGSTNQIILWNTYSFQWKHFSGTRMQFNASIPIAEWQGQGTSIAMTESLVESNYKFRTKTITNLNIADDTLTEISNWGNTSHPDFDGTTWTCPADGYYNYSICFSWSASSLTAKNALLQVDAGDNWTNISRMTHDAALYPTSGVVSDTVFMKKGDELVSYAQQNSGSPVEIQNQNSHFTITRVPDYTAGTLPSFGIASESEYGLVKAAQVFSVGSIQQSILTEAQFQSENGSDWKLWGASTDIAGTKLGSLLGTDTLPDATGRVFRNAGGAAADVGEGQDDATAVNGLEASSSFSSRGNAWAKESMSNERIVISNKDYSGTMYDQTGNIKATVGNYDAGGIPDPFGYLYTDTTLTGDTETRMINITLNTFIKVN